MQKEEEGEMGGEKEGGEEREVRTTSPFEARLSFPGPPCLSEAAVVKSVTLSTSLPRLSQAVSG